MRWILIVACLAISAPLSAHDVSLTATGSQALANVGDDAETFSNTATILVMIQSHDGPISDLGLTTGDGSEEIDLPDGWHFRTLQVPPGGCWIKPARFWNMGGGVYQIRVHSRSSTSICPWRHGEYHFSIGYADLAFVRYALGEILIDG